MKLLAGFLGSIVAQTQASFHVITNPNDYTLHVHLSYVRLSYFCRFWTLKLLLIHRRKK